jgi:hypothetical protein
MSNKSKTSAARTAQPVPVPAGGPLPCQFQNFSFSAFSPTAHRITAHRITAHRITVNRITVNRITVNRITAPRPRPISASASVTLHNSYGECYKRKKGSNPVLVGTSMFTISCNKPGNEPVTLRTLP